MQDYRRMRVWHAATDLAVLVYRITSEFPEREKFGLSSQMRRAAVSIPSNIAEGCGRSSRNDFARFVEIALGSAFELEAQTEIARRLGYVNGIEDVGSRTSQVIRMLGALVEALRSERGQRLTD